MGNFIFSISNILGQTLEFPSNLHKGMETVCHEEWILSYPQKRETHQAHQFRHILITLITEHIWHFPKAKKKSQYDSFYILGYRETAETKSAWNTGTSLSPCSEEAERLF